jgi:hypothetical protein
MVSPELSSAFVARILGIFFIQKAVAVVILTVIPQHGLVHFAGGHVVFLGFGVPHNRAGFVGKINGHGRLGKQDQSTDGNQQFFHETTLLLNNKQKSDFSL